MKLKTHSGAKKRVKITGTGKLIMAKSCKRHLLSDKSKQAKGRDKYGRVVSDANISVMKIAIPGV